MRKLIIIVGTVLSVLGVSLLSVAVPASSGGGDTDLSKFSNDELVSSAQAMVRKMESQLGDAFKLLEASVTAGDVGATTARNDAITKIKSLLKLSEENFVTLQGKIAVGERDDAEHEYVKIAIILEKVNELMSQVRAAGGIDVDIESAQVNSEVDYDGDFPLLADLAIAFLEPVDLVPDPPIHASPYF